VGTPSQLFVDFCQIFHQSGVCAWLRVPLRSRYLGESEILQERVQPHPYGFPDDWFYWIETGKDSGYGGIRCFQPPDLSKLPPERLKNHALFQRLLLSLRDFAHARSAISFIRDDVDFEQMYGLAELRRFQCYETTLVVSYCRPFSESIGDFPRLSYRTLGIKLSPFVKALHDDLVDKRNKLFAHSDVGSVEYARPVVIHDRDAKGRPFTTLFPPRFQEGTLLHEAEFEQVSVLVECASNAVMHMLQAMHVHFADLYPSIDSETL